MRRKDREIQEMADKLMIIEKCKFCRLGMSDDNQPYIVPMNYGFSYENDKLILYFHSAKEGKKIDIIRNNNKACFEIDCDTGLIEGDIACKYSYEFRSVLGFGKIFFMDTDEEKIYGLNKLMKHQTGKNISFAFSENELKNVLVFKLVIEEFTGKERILKKLE